MTGGAALKRQAVIEGFGDVGREFLREMGGGRVTAEPIARLRVWEECTSTPGQGSIYLLLWAAACPGMLLALGLAGLECFLTVPSLFWLSGDTEELCWN